MSDKISVFLGGEREKPDLRKVKISGDPKRNVLTGPTLFNHSRLSNCLSMRLLNSGNDINDGPHKQ